MDGRSRYNKLKTMLKPLQGQKMHLEKIKRLVMIDIGSSEACIQETTKFMIDVGMIREVDNWIFEVKDDSGLQGTG